MGLDDDYSREDIDETLKNHSQDIGVCYFHRQKVQFAWMGAKHFEIQKTFPLFYLESEHFFFSGLDCLTLGASREPLMESHEAYQVFQRNLFFWKLKFFLENEMLLNYVSIFRFYAKSWQERE